MSEKQNTLKIVVVGHVDHGKSTVIGRLLHDTQSLPEGTINKVKRIAKETGKPFEYAYLLDAFEEEQKQGITIDTTQIQFQTKKRDYVIIDAPGHKEFLKNMISGAANAEAALLVIDVKEGVQEQSKRHAYILSLLGIKKVYVVLNKMDLVDYSEEVFNDVSTAMNKFLGELDVYPLAYIPVSAYYGENILDDSTKMPWYKGQSIINAIDSLENEKGIEERSLRFPIQDVYKFDDRRIIAGRIESGKLKVGDEIVIYPEGKKTQVKTIEYWVEKDKKDEIKAGESVGITVTDEFFNKRGEIITKAENPPFISNSFRANIFWMGKNDLVKNKKYKIKLTTQEVEGEIDKIIKVIDASSLNSNEEVSKVVLNDVAEVIIKTKEPVVFDAFKDSQITGRFVIVDGYDVAGGGIVVKSEEGEVVQGLETFKFQGVKARGDIFEEFYYDVESQTVNKEIATTNTYTVGDSLPLKGESYEYPSYFDILVIRDKVAIAVRDGKVNNIVALEDYQYSGYPLTNGRGFEIKAKTSEEIKDFVEGYSNIDEKTEAEYLNKWVNFDTYRKVVFRFDK
ncbi:sulfate adenylyltransferase subunit 1 [Clostridium cellulovorans]|uniref:sulfate adenylyltransferase n=1 Tax=Clostridium cellulovorans (strain ATCC 35296 / DSM 3052 / OCM 3 / 743B) TaxID=573061 RepID=D9SR15_CLOC7|nr:GTP-binding protein [Clostridium cellulovorans]ADL50303.1 sulfate adenylyltransferase, large subunit [Clostridium cellulovorans 743B]